MEKKKTKAKRAPSRIISPVKRSSSIMVQHHTLLVSLYIHGSHLCNTEDRHRWGLLSKTSTFLLIVMSTIIPAEAMVFSRAIIAIRAATLGRSTVDLTKAMVAISTRAVKVLTMWT